MPTSLQFLNVVEDEKPLTISSQDFAPLRIHGNFKKFLANNWSA